MSLIEEFDSNTIVYIIQQFYPNLYNQLEQLSNKKNKLFTDLIWIKIFKNYHKQLCSVYNQETIKSSILYITQYFSNDKQVIDTLEPNMIF